MQNDDTASVATGATSAALRNIPATDLACDSKFVQKLFRKIKRALTTRGAYGQVEIAEPFRRLDRAITREAADMEKRNVALSRQQSKSFMDPYADAYYSHQEGRGGTAMRDTYSVDCNNFFRFIFDGLTMEGVSAKEVEVMFVLMDTDEDGYVDMADVLLAIRKLFHCTAQQFHDVLKRLRSRIPQIANGGSPFRRKNGALPSRPPTRESVFKYLLSGSGSGGRFELTESEAYLFLDYCSVQEKDGQAADNSGLNADSSGQRSASRSPSLGRALGELDIPYIESVLFSEALPDDVAYPLLISKFVEAATDSLKGDRSGTAGMLRALRQCTLRPHPDSRQGRRPSGHQMLAAGMPSNRQAAFGDSPDARRAPLGARAVGSDADSSDDEERGGAQHSGGETDLMDKCLDIDNFRKFLHIFQGGLPVGECDLLFGYLCDHSTSLLGVATLIHQFQNRLDVWSAVDMGLAVGAIQHNVNLMQLHVLLSGRFGSYSEIPLENAIAALRRCGVSAAVLSDIEVEQVYRETRTTSALVLLIRGSIPHGREVTIGKLFEKLDDDDDGVIPSELLIRAFDPSQLPSAKQAAQVQFDMLGYLGTLSAGTNVSNGGLTYSEFSYFWGCLALKFDSDSSFSLFIWKAYRMQEPKRRGFAAVINERRPPVPIERLVGHGYGQRPSGNSLAPTSESAARGYRPSVARGMSPMPGASRSFSRAASANPNHGFSRNTSQISDYNNVRRR